MGILIKNIKELLQVEDTVRNKVCGKDMAIVPSIKSAWIYLKDDKIVDFGEMNNCPDIEDDFLVEIDAQGKMVMPSFCDSHTHLVYAGSRELEYSDKIRGLSYEEIAKRGGGILNSAALLHNTSEDELYNQSLERIHEIIAQGTGAVEIKSGYGLNTEDELKMLRVIKRLKETTPILIKSTFLGAHSVPAKYIGNTDKYVDVVINEMLPRVIEEKLADYIDVFCDVGFFTPEQTELILDAGAKYGLRPKIHANELALSGGIQVGTKYNALSVDHIEYTEENEIKALQNSETMPTILPGAAFFLNMPYAPARKMINAGLPVAIASDFNPGSSPSGNMQLMMSFACVNYKMLPQEALNATTINTAYAMGVSDKVGSIAKGKFANLIITKEIPNLEFIPYSYGSDIIDTIILKGQIL